MRKKTPVKMEYCWNTHGLRSWRLVWRFITSRKFRLRLKYVVFYALNHYKTNGGEGASDVYLFDSMDSAAVIRGKK
jgi:hypothetical protein